jgi:hypothetical protein
MRTAERGQGTVEYVGVVALVALVLAAAATVWTDPQAIGGAVTRALARGLCVVSGGFCDADRQPCVTAARSEERGWHVNLAVFRYGEDDVVLREERSDGTVALTHTHDRDGGLDVGVGADAHVSGISVGASLRAAILAHLGKGETYVVPTAQADAVQARIVAGDGRLPRPATTYGEWGARRSYDATVAGGPFELAAGYGPADADGTAVDTATGRTTVYLAPAEGWHGSLSLADDELAGAGTMRQERYGVVLDRAGRPRELVVTAIGELHGSAELPAALAEVAGYLLVPSGAGGGRQWSLETHLDLSDPEVAQAAAAFVDEIRHPRLHVGSRVAPSAELRQLLRERGQSEARTYALDEDSSGFGGHFAAGPKVGGAKETTRRTTRLLAATSRGPGGGWRRRDDCLADA